MRTRGLEFETVSVCQDLRFCPQTLVWWQKARSGLLEVICRAALMEVRSERVFLLGGSGLVWAPSVGWVSAPLVRGNSLAVADERIFFGCGESFVNDSNVNARADETWCNSL